MRLPVSLVQVFRACAVLVLAAAFGFANFSQARSSDWDVNDTKQPFHDVSLTLTEGTWISLDVSPDGRRITFDLLGDIYEISASGGEGALLHGGPAMQRAPMYSPDGKSLLYLSDADGTDNVWVSQRNGAGPRQISRERLKLVMGAAWNPSGAGVAVSRMDSGVEHYRATEILLLNAKDGSSAQIVPRPENDRDVQESRFSPDGKYLYYTQRLGQGEIYFDAMHMNYAIMRRDLKTKETVQLIGGFGGAVAPAVSRDGKKIAFVRRVRAKTVLFTYDVITGEERPVFDGLDRDLMADFVAQGAYYPRFAWFPDNRDVAIWAGGKIKRINTDTGDVRDIPFKVKSTHRITDRVAAKADFNPDRVVVRSARHMAPSSNGRTILLTMLGHLWVKDSPEAPPRRFTNAENFEFDAAFSPKENSVAYVEWDDVAGSTLRVSPRAGGRGKAIAQSPGIMRQPKFSPDGRSIVYRVAAPDKSMGGYRGRPGIYIVPVKGGRSRFLTAGDDEPVFAPDGARVYFVAAAGRGEALKSVKLDGGDLRVHGHTPDPDTSELRLSPDLRNLAFRDRTQYYVQAFDPGAADIEFSAKAGAAKRLTLRGGNALAWRPDSGAIHWNLGAELFQAGKNEFSASAPEDPKAFAKIGLEAPVDKPRGRVAFRNARVITMRRDEVIEKADLVVNGNLIEAVGPSGAITIPSDAHVVDATGRTIMPGLIDMHGHIDCCFGAGVLPKQQPSRFAALAFGVTTNFDPYSNDLTTYESTELTEAGLTVGPRWLGSGFVVYGRSGKADRTFVPIDRYEDAEIAVQRRKAMGGFFIKSYKQPARFQRQMLVKAGRETGVFVDAEGESQIHVNITQILDGHSNYEHNIPVAVYYDDLIQLMAAAKAHNTPTLNVVFGELFGENYMYQRTRVWENKRLSRFAPEVISYYSPLQAPSGAPVHVRAMTSIHAADELYEIGVLSVSRSIDKLDQAGVVINAGSHGELPGLGLHWEMRLLAAGGMSPMRVLRTATVNAASTLGVEDQLGSIEPGKLADLIVLERNPLEDISNSETVLFTMVNGRLYDADSMKEIGNYDQPRSKFYWERKGADSAFWNESWAGQ